MVQTNSILYKISDAAGNVSVETRTVNIVDTTPPVISLMGDTVVSIPFGASYDDAGATASDNYDGNLTDFIVNTTNNVNKHSAGTYVVTYDVSDSSGNNAVQKSRIINVVDTTPSPISFTLKINDSAQNGPVLGFSDYFGTSGLYWRY